MRLVVEHVDSHDACDAQNTESEVFFFSRSACACVIISLGDETCDNENLTLEDGCLDDCVLDQILDHGLTEQCEIPDDDTDRLHQHSSGWHKHSRRTRCRTRVSHRYKGVSLEQEEEEESPEESESQLEDTQVSEELVITPEPETIVEE